MTQSINRKVIHEIERWGHLFRSKKAKVQRQGLTVAQARQTRDAAKIKRAEQKLAEMRKDYWLTKSLLLK